MLQYVDKNVGPADYKNLQSDQLLVTKVFGVTVQGEGPFAGMPAVFIRLAGCDKGDKQSCQWCDTDFRFYQGITIDIPTIVKQVQARFEATFQLNLSSHPPLVIITGGEPMLQNNIVPLIEALDKAKFIVQIESNGDRLADGFLDSDACYKAKLVVSPKVNPASKQYKRLSDRVFQRIDYLKFIVEADKTSPYHSLPPFIYEWVMYMNDPSRVFISPVTAYKRPVTPGEIASVWLDDLIDKEVTARNYAHASHLVIRYGYRLSCQLHTFLGVE